MWLLLHHGITRLMLHYHAWISPLSLLDLNPREGKHPWCTWGKEGRCHG